MRPSALLRRLWRAQLRLRVMAGVVVVMLVAIAAFDVGAVATMRRYLLGQTDKNLQVTLDHDADTAAVARARLSAQARRVVATGAVAPRRVQHHLLPAGR